MVAIAIGTTAQGMLGWSSRVIIGTQLFTDSGITLVKLSRISTCRQLFGQVMAGTGVRHAYLQNKQGQDHDNQARRGS